MYLCMCDFVFVYLSLYSSDNDKPWLFEAALQEACWGRGTPWQPPHLGRRWTACFDIIKVLFTILDNLNLVAST